jgi:hypothetical protein
MIALDQNNHTINLAKLNKIQLVKILFTIQLSHTITHYKLLPIHTKNWNKWSENQRKTIIVWTIQRSKSLFVKSNYIMKDITVSS